MWLTVVRDVAIVLLAFESVVVGILLALMLVQIRSLVRLLREEIAPILDSTSETVNTVQSTADFVSESVVNPLIELRSYTTGTWQALRSLVFVGRKLRGRDSSDTGDGDSKG